MPVVFKILTPKNTKAPKGILPKIGSLALKAGLLALSRKYILKNIKNDKDKKKWKSLFQGIVTTNPKIKNRKKSEKEKKKSTFKVLDKILLYARCNISDVIKTKVVPKVDKPSINTLLFQASPSLYAELGKIPGLKDEDKKKILDYYEFDKSLTPGEKEYIYNNKLLRDLSVEKKIEVISALHKNGKVTGEDLVKIGIFDKRKDADFEAGIINRGYQDCKLTEDFAKSVALKSPGNGIAIEHQAIRDLANEIEVGDVKQWTTPLFSQWLISGRDDAIIGDFKNSWIRGYREVIKQAAERYDIPEYLLAGTIKIEVGGDPIWSDPVIYTLRKELPDYIRKIHPQLQADKDNTSFGNVSIQIRRAAESLGYDEPLTKQQRGEIIKSLLNPKQEIFIAAKHLSDLRDIDFKGIEAENLTEEQVKIIGSRYNLGPDLKIGQILTGYGDKIVDNRELLEDLLNE